MALDREQSVVDYRQLAAGYDDATRRIGGVRQAAITALRLHPGETVLDVGCGTGFNFAQILTAIGQAGHLLAFDHSSDLLAIARRRVADAGWRNITVRHAYAEAVNMRDELSRHGIAPPSAVLFSYVHDVMQSEGALNNLFSQVAPGARVSITSTRLWPRTWWPLCVPVNRYLYRTHKLYITNRDENFDRPWGKNRSPPRSDHF